MKRVLMGSDKSGFALKEEIKAHLLEQGYKVEDIGTQREDAPVPYFGVAPLAAEKISSGEYERAILCCGTGMGMALVANKYQGVYAACCESVYAAEKCRAVNDANILTMGGWVVGGFMGCAMADAFLNTGFTDNLEEWRKEFLCGAREQVKEIEKRIYGEKQG